MAGGKSRFHEIESTTKMDSDVYTASCTFLNSCTSISCFKKKKYSKIDFYHNHIRGHSAYCENGSWKTLIPTGEDYLSCHRQPTGLLAADQLRPDR